MTKFLVGNFNYIRDACGYDKPKFLDKINKEHLIKAKNNSDYQIIDLETNKYFDPEKNEWKEIK